MFNMWSKIYQSSCLCSYVPPDVELIILFSCVPADVGVWIINHYVRFHSHHTIQQGKGTYQTIITTAGLSSICRLSHYSWSICIMTKDRQKMKEATISY